MQQRQLRLGDILDDYCPRERRVTNHAVVAMVGEDVKQTRCTTCDADHEYKHAKVPRQRRKDTPAALYSQVAAGGPKRVVHEAAQEHEADMVEEAAPGDAASPPAAPAASEDRLEHRHESRQEDRQENSPEHSPERVAAAVEPKPALAFERDPVDEDAVPDEREDAEEGPAHRRLIRATLPRIEGQPPPTRPAPDFTIRQPNSRHGRFRNPRGASSFHNSNRSGNVGGGDGMPRHGGGRPPVMSRQGKRHGPPQGGRKRSK
jgi:hypothetical protein